MKIIRRLDSTGDTVLEFNEVDAKATAEAKALFDRLTKEGRQAFAVNRADKQPNKRVDDFGQIENDTVFIPRIQGG